MPSVRKNETKNEYIARCMKSEEMQKEFPKQGQRLAVCHKYWKNKK